MGPYCHIYATRTCTVVVDTVETQFKVCLYACVMGKDRYWLHDTDNNVSALTSGQIKVHDAATLPNNPGVQSKDGSRIWFQDHGQHHRTRLDVKESFFCDRLSRDTITWSATASFIYQCNVYWSLHGPQSSAMLLCAAHASSLWVSRLHWFSSVLMNRGFFERARREVLHLKDVPDYDRGRHWEEERNE